ncbi:MAG: helix-turn-helix transcriptional regulator [Prevotella sp.]|jgi:predicted DNA-binding transcriptional regulator YafY
MKNSSARFERWFALILTMIDGQGHTAKELAEVLGTSLRNLYYVLGRLRSMGFNVVHERTLYHIDIQSPFLRRIASAIDFTEDEVVFLHEKLLGEAHDSPMAGIIKRKLERFYNLTTYGDVHFRQRLYENTNLLEQALNSKRVVILHDYSSPHSHTVSDRVVEPFLFYGDRADIRAYELKSRQNKTFKIARIGSVEIVDTPWFNAHKHREVFTDMFMFSGEQKFHIKLRFSLLAHHLMLEEYPHSGILMTREDTEHWIFETDVVNYVGISRFILGLFEEIEILENSDLRRFLRSKIERMKLH